MLQKVIGEAIVRNQLFTTPKVEIPVSLWESPEGRVESSVFVECCDENGIAIEQPSDLCNDRDFLVVRCTGKGEVRFYNKRSLVRIDDIKSSIALCLEEDDTELSTRLFLLDGSLLDGVIQEVLSAERQRLDNDTLDDDINAFGRPFLRLYPLTHEVNTLAEDPDMRPVCLVNKACIVRISPLSD